jgi:hypothetical protein
VTAAKRKPTKKPTRRRAPKKPAAAPATEYGKVLVLRTCLADMRSPSNDARGFVWPRSGPVEAKDWNPRPICGFGLHGALWGEGEGSAPWVWSDDGVWLVVEVDADTIVDLGGKVKFPRGVVVFAGPQLEATTFLAKRAPGRVIVGGTATAGDGGELRIREWDLNADRCRTRVAWVGEGGIEKGVAYELVNGKFIPRAKR